MTLGNMRKLGVRGFRELVTKGGVRPACSIIWGHKPTSM
jgi:hypothetical protein